ncbi:lytic murein transglycosylase [Variovorax sp. ZT4R33]|uniref:lytic murein transglycosylase n=1 Tax=Variovorax sp. ZT4R33 TaxID=3443743 RepID=UPI003F4828E9
MALTGCGTPPAASTAGGPDSPPAAGIPAAPSTAFTPQQQPAVDTSADAQRRLASWLADLRTRALAAGLRASTLDAALNGAQYLPRVVELDRAQPEFTRPIWDYLDTAVSPQRVANGLEKQAQVQREAAAAAARYGVPAEVLVAIWGLESNYGGNYGSTPTIDALATLGVDGRREDFARRELLAALTIVDNGDIDRDHMVGSWAGAMGQTQFLPTNFLAYAVDADGDGKRDIWGSMADVMASTAHFLARSGWQAGQPWGAEVRLPTGFDPALADASERRPSAQWAAAGVQAQNGALPDLMDAELLLPAGARGPAFLVGPNFRVILRYNNAVSYALAVSLLSQRLAGGPAVVAPWPRELRTLSRSETRELQEALNARGFDSGTPDGVVGAATRRAIRAYQRASGLPADAYPTDDLLARLRR